MIKNIDKKTVQKILEQTLLHCDKNINKDESIQFIDNCLNKINNGEKVKYEDLPETFKKMVMCIYINPENKLDKDEISNDIVKLFINEIEKEVSLDEFMKDYNEEMSKFQNITTQISNEYVDETNEKFISMLDKSIEEIKSKDNYDENNLNTLLNIKDIAINAHKFEKIKELIEKNGKKYIKKYSKLKPQKVFRELKFRYSKTKFKINDNFINMVYSIVRHTKKCNSNLSSLLMVIIIKSFDELDINNIENHMYINFTLRAIYSLDLYTKDNDTYKETINVLQEIIDILLSQISEIEENNGR